MKSLRRILLALSLLGAAVAAVKAVRNRNELDAAFNVDH